MYARLSLALETYVTLKEQIPPASIKVIEDAEDEIRAACEEISIVGTMEISRLISLAKSG